MKRIWGPGRGNVGSLGLEGPQVGTQGKAGKDLEAGTWARGFRMGTAPGSQVRSRCNETGEQNALIKLLGSTRF